MEAESAQDYTKTTQLLLGKYVKRPPLTDKLLKKPPFRFLHDIVTSVVKTTGFFKGLFEEDELISENVKDRESKILFLNKIISVISSTTGKNISIKPSKIVAGQEPEKTNELLQYLAFALDNNLSSDEAVKVYKESMKLNVSEEIKEKDVAKPVKKITSTRKISSKDSDKSIKTDKSGTNVSKTKQKENIGTKKEPTKNLIIPSKGTIKRRVNIDKEKLLSNKKTTISSTNINDKEESVQNSINTDPANDEAEFVKVNQNLTSLSSHDLDFNNDADKKIETYIDSNNSITKENLQSQETLQTEDEFKDRHLDLVKNENKVLILNNDKEISNDKTEQEEKNNEQKEYIVSQNNETINLDKNIEKVNANKDITSTVETKVTDVSNLKRPLSVRPSSSRPGAPRLRDKHDSVINNTENLVVGKVNIIVESTTNEEDEESSIVVVVNANTLNNVDETELQVSSNQHGHLVQQILEAQKEFSQVTGKTEIEWQFGAQKARDMVTQEIEQLRFNVQALSRVANPLGKVLDHIQEDVEVMRQELHQWTKTYEESTNELVKQKAANEESLLPLHAKIKHLYSDIAEKQDKINDLKIVIHKNAFRIEKLLLRGNV